LREVQPALSRLASPAIASALGVLALALLVAAVPLEELSHQSLLSHLNGLPVVATFGVVGVIVARQRPRHPMGWIFLGIAIGFPLNSDASLYSILDYRLHHGALPFGPVAVLLQPAWAPAILLSGLAILLFPDGRLPGNRLRWVAWGSSEWVRCGCSAPTSSQRARSSSTPSTSSPPAI
jgi:hypothetical protein